MMITNDLFMKGVNRMNMEKAVEELLKAYSEIFDRQGAPEWAVHKKGKPGEFVRPTIPFVGKDYFEQDHKILVYASAENLTGYKSTKGYLDDDIAKNRHRWDLNNNPENLSDDEFPIVHMQPMNDGGLAVVALYLLSKLEPTREFDCKPKEFIEMLSFGNCGKFSIEANNNIDYAYNKEKLCVSLEYIKADIEYLNPNYIIIPQGIYSTIKTDIDKIKGNAIIVPIYQINSGVINRTVKRYYERINITELYPLIADFYDKIKYSGKTKENFLAIFSYLDKVFIREKINKEDNHGSNNK